MIRFLVQTVLVFIANAVGLAVSASLFEGFDINGTAFFMAVVVFTLTTILIGPFVAKMALSHASYLMGGISLVTTFIGLIVTTVLTDGISIDGITTWFMVTVTVWFFAMIANVLFPLLVMKRIFKDDKNTEAVKS